MSASTRPLMIELGLEMRSVTVIFSGGDSAEWGRMMREFMAFVGIDEARYLHLIEDDPEFLRFTFHRQLDNERESDQSIRQYLGNLLPKGEKIRPY